MERLSFSKEALRKHPFFSKFPSIESPLFIETIFSTLSDIALYYFMTGFKPPHVEIEKREIEGKPFAVFLIDGEFLWVPLKETISLEGHVFMSSQGISSEENSLLQEKSVVVWDTALLDTLWTLRFKHKANEVDCIRHFLCLLKETPYHPGLRKFFCFMLHTLLTSSTKEKEEVITLLRRWVEKAGETALPEIGVFGEGMEIRLFTMIHQDETLFTYLFEKKGKFWSFYFQGTRGLDFFKLFCQLAHKVSLPHQKKVFLENFTKWKEVDKEFVFLKVSELENSGHSFTGTEREVVQEALTEEGQVVENQESLNLLTPKDFLKQFSSLIDKAKKEHFPKYKEALQKGSAAEKRNIFSGKLQGFWKKYPSYAAEILLSLYEKNPKDAMKEWADLKRNPKIFEAIFQEERFSKLGSVFAAPYLEEGLFLFREEALAFLLRNNKREAFLQGVSSSQKFIEVDRIFRRMEGCWHSLNPLQKDTQACLFKLFTWLKQGELEEANKVDEASIFESLLKKTLEIQEIDKNKLEEYEQLLIWMESLPVDPQKTLAGRKALLKILINSTYKHVKGSFSFKMSFLLSSHRLEELQGTDICQEYFSEIPIDAQAELICELSLPLPSSTTQILQNLLAQNKTKASLRLMVYALKTGAAREWTSLLENQLSLFFSHLKNLPLTPELEELLLEIIRVEGGGLSSEKEIDEMLFEHLPFTNVKNLNVEILKSLRLKGNNHKNTPFVFSRLIFDTKVFQFVEKNPNYLLWVEDVFRESSHREQLEEALFFIGNFIVSEEEPQYSILRKYFFRLYEAVKTKLSLENGPLFFTILLLSLEKTGAFNLPLLELDNLKNKSILNTSRRGRIPSQHLIEAVKYFIKGVEENTQNPEDTRVFSALTGLSHGYIADKSEADLQSVLAFLIEQFKLKPSTPIVMSLIHLSNFDINRFYSLLLFVYQDNALFEEIQQMSPDWNWSLYEMYYMTGIFLLEKCETNYVSYKDVHRLLQNILLPMLDRQGDIAEKCVFYALQKLGYKKIIRGFLEENFDKVLSFLERSKQNSKNRLEKKEKEKPGVYETILASHPYFLLGEESVVEVSDRALNNEHDKVALLRSVFSEAFFNNVSPFLIKKILEKIVQNPGTFILQFTGKDYEKFDLFVRMLETSFHRLTTYIDVDREYLLLFQFLNDKIKTPRIWSFSTLPRALFFSMLVMKMDSKDCLERTQNCLTYCEGFEDPITLVLGMSAVLEDIFINIPPENRKEIFGRLQQIILNLYKKTHGGSSVEKRLKNSLFMKVLNLKRKYFPEEKTDLSPIYNEVIVKNKEIEIDVLPLMYLPPILTDWLEYLTHFEREEKEIPLLEGVVGMYNEFFERFPLESVSEAGGASIVREDLKHFHHALGRFIYSFKGKPVLFFKLWKECLKNFGYVPLNFFDQVFNEKKNQLENPSLNVKLLETKEALKEKRDVWAQAFMEDMEACSIAENQPLAFDEDTDFSWPAQGFIMQRT